MTIFTLQHNMLSSISKRHADISASTASIHLALSSLGSSVKTLKAVYHAEVNKKLTQREALTWKIKVNCLPKLIQKRPTHILHICV